MEFKSKFFRIKKICLAKMRQLEQQGDMFANCTHISRHPETAGVGGKGAEFNLY